MSFDDDETGVESSEPRELFEVSHGNGAVRYYMTSGQRNIAYGGNLYIAQSVARMDIIVNPITADVDFAMVVPASHALVKRWFTQFSPPNRISVTVRRMQLNSGEVEEIWIGYVTAMSLDGNEAKFRIPSRAQQAMQVKLPTTLVSSTCPHILYDQQCKLDRTAHSYAGEIQTADGRDVTILFTVPIPADQAFAQFGELVHQPSGESQTIWKQTGWYTLQLNAPIAGMKLGDLITIVAGCAHDINTCKTKFDNVVNYGGLVDRPTRDPFFPTGFGVVEQF